MSVVIFLDDGDHGLRLEGHRFLCLNNKAMGYASAMSARSLQYYVIAKRWASDLDFFEVEAAFLHRLIKSHTTRFPPAALAEQFKAATHSLQKLEKDKLHADRLLEKQLAYTELMAEDVIPERAEELAVNQVRLEYMMTNLGLQYREIKKAIFELVDAAMKEHKHSYRLHAN